MRKKIISLLLVMCMLFGLMPQMTATASADNIDGYIYFTVERATLGQGFILEPVKIAYTEDESLSELTDRALKQAGLTYYNTGSIQEDFYLSNISDGGEPAAWTKADIPVAINSVLTSEYGGAGGRTSANILSEGDYSSYSGWMYSLDNKGISVGSSGVTYADTSDSSHYTNDSVVRLQFTVYGYGADLNTYDPSYGGTPVGTLYDKDDLIKLAADCNDKTSDEYKNAITVLSDWSATEEDIAAAEAAFNLNPLPTEASVDFAVQADGAYLCAPQSDIDVYSNLAESYGYTDSVDGVSVLDVMVKAHEITFEDAFTAETATEFLVVSNTGTVSRLFGVDTTANGFLLNKGYPNDGSVSQYGGYNGTLVTTQEVVNNDFIDLFCYQDSSYYSDEIAYTEVTSSSAIVGQNITVNIKSTGIMMGYKYATPEALQSSAEACGGVALAWVDMASGATTEIEGVITDDNGDATLEAPSQAGTYYLTAVSNSEDEIYLLMNPVKVVVEGEKSNHNVTIANTVNGSIQASSANVLSGDTVTLTVTPDNTYALKTLVINGKTSGDIIERKINTDNNKEFTFIMPDEDVQITAEFGLEYTLNMYSVPTSGVYNSIYVLNSVGDRIAYTTKRANASKPYVFMLPAGNYSYVIVNEDDKETARGSLEVSDSGDTAAIQNIYLVEIDFRFDYTSVTEGYSCDAVISLKDPDNKEIKGYRYENSDISNPDGKNEFEYRFIVEAKGLDYEYTYHASMADDGLVLDVSTGKLSYDLKKTTQRKYVYIAPRPITDTITFKVPKGAGIGVYKKTAGHYAPFYEYKVEASDFETDETYDIYTYGIPKRSRGNIHVVAGGSEGDSDYIKTVRIFDSFSEDTYTIDPEKLDNSDRRNCSFAHTFGSENTPLYETVEADMFLNVPDSNYIKLNGDNYYYTLRGYRVNQAQYGDTANYFIEPDFHYEIISGNSVEIVKTEDSVPGNEFVNLFVTEQPGVSIVRVTYDAMMFKQGSSEYGYFNATDPLNERIIVVNVSDCNDFETGITEREYDTIYYTEKTVMPDGREVIGDSCAKYTFTPKSGSEVSVHAPLNGGQWSDADWKEYIQNEDGSFTVDLTSGENIIQINNGDDVAYYVVSAKGITVYIKNDTNPGKSLQVGDTASISFESLNLPNKKMAGLYNPGFPDTTWTYYNCDKDKCTQSGIIPDEKVTEGIVRNRGAQYVVASKLCNTISFKVCQEGTLELTGGRIHSEHFGSALGAHRELDGTGIPANLNASNNTADANFSTLPDITLDIGGETDWKGSGTQDDPYLISSAYHLQKLSTLCSNGDTFSEKFFKMTDNITLPADWTPIGVKGKPFSGTFDGDGHLLTVPKDEKPLLGTIRMATVKNLNIYGERINGYGLVNGYCVDSGVALSIEIINCTLKTGTNTTKSGFIGGYASGMNTVNIRNCTIESGVVIGCDADQSNIGSFAGELNGSIVGCTSYATVKGVNFVGGICGNKGQTMGDYMIIDCTFEGSVVASGDNVGGISGAGYGGTLLGVDSAPNTPCATIKNCLVTGSISGNNNVGGILGSELGLKEAWNNGTGYIQNNLFVGNISATGDHKGAIIGYMNSINNMNIITDNYYLNTCGADKGIGAAGMVETLESNDTFGTGFNKVTLSGKKYGRTDDPMGAGADKLTKGCTAVELKDGTILNLLNNNLNSNKNWISSDKYPIIKQTADKYLINISSNQISTSGGLTQEANGSDVLAGKTITLKYSDGAIETISATDEAVTKQYTLNNDMIGKWIQTSIVYDGHQLAFVLYVTSTRPVLKDGINKEAEAAIDLGKSYTVDLNSIFEDAEGDTLSYKVKIDKAKKYISAETIEGVYSYKPETVGTTTLTFKANDGTNDSLTTYKVVITTSEPAPIQKSNNTEISSIVVKNEIATADKDNKLNYTAILPYNTAAPVLNDFVISLADKNTSITTALQTSDNGNTWMFTVTAEDGTTTATYSIKVVYGENPAKDNIEAVNNAKTSILAAGFNTSQKTANTEASIKEYIASIITALELNNVSADIEITSMTPAIAGTAQSINGTNGSFTAIVTLVKGLNDTLANDTVTITGIIEATKYSTTPTSPENGGNSSPSTGGNYSGTGSSTAQGTTGDNIAVISGNTATVKVSDENINKAIDAAKESGDKTITIKHQNIDNINAIKMVISKDSIKNIVSDTDLTLEVETTEGNISIPNDALAAITSKTGSDDVSLTVKKASKDTLESNSIDDENVVAVEVTISANGKAITEFDGYDIEIGIPVDNKYTEGNYYKTLVISSNGNTEICFGKCVKRNGQLYVDINSKHLSTFIVTTEVKIDFNDVKANDWFYNAISYCVNNHLFEGVDNNCFDPDAEMTRAMFVTVLYRLDGNPETSGENSFMDVKAGSWYSDAIIWAKSNGIVTGNSDGGFGVNDIITREQMAMMLMRYAKYKNYSTTLKGTLSGYIDADTINSYAKDAMCWTNSEGLITGRTADKLAPADFATRAEVATILMRFMKNIVK